MYRNLNEYIERLEAMGELLRVGARVDPVYEIAEITDRMSKTPGGGKALLFEDTGTGFPVLTNMMGSDRRIAAALGAGSLDEIGDRLDRLVAGAMSPKEGLWEKLSMLPLLAGAARWMPRKTGGRGECQQVVYRGTEVDLGILPVLKCWPYDGGRFVTLPLVHTEDPDTGARNVGMYRMQVTGPDTTGMHWHLHKTGERHYRAYARRGERMPVSVALGGDPAYTYSATAPMPDNLDEYLLAGFLRGRAVRLVKCLTNDLYVPADCDIVIEGYVDPAEEKFTEGPFGDHTGFYSLEDLYPRFHVTAVTHRRGAVYPATVVGIPPQEDAYIAKATEKIFLAPIRAAIQPEVKDLYMPPEGVAHNLALVSIDRQYDGQAFKTASAMWGAGQMMFNKVMLVAGADTDIRDAGQVAALLRGVAVPDDILLSRGVLDVLDHATATPGSGGKLALDLTGKTAPNGEVSLPEGLPLPPGAAVVDVSLAREWAVVLVGYRDASPADLTGLADALLDSGVRFIVAVDRAVLTLSPGDILWHAAGNYEPGRDTTLRGGILIADGRTKYPYREGFPQRVPNVVTSSSETVALVDRRWEEYGTGGFIPSPSERYAPLRSSPSAAVGGEGESAGQI
ncbi:MAG: menaquinone biosynthesis decarboxylase [Rikenellaceae bacterium]|nr:menaquinone biosynthesis decarboxylase [Rikenellaceae bacterium]